jgi:oligoribonuclease NrnB/cAMP/cGMP phosphodiesterase (DHH superfamily)
MIETKKDGAKAGICVSHMKDVDGCVAAALIKHATNSHILLANYGNMNECLRSIYESFDIVYVSDLGINERTVQEFERIRKFAEITYIDHHPLDPEILSLIKKMGVTVVHSQLDCAGVITYNMFESSLPRDAGLLAAYAAVSDRLENGPQARKILRRHEHDFVIFEAMMLSYAIEKADTSFKKKLVTRLSKLEYPHQIPEVPGLALEQAESVASLRKELLSRTERIGDVCYADAKEDSPGMVANLLIEVCGAKIGIGYKTSGQTQISDLSIRGASSLKLDLGEKASKLSRKLGGTGGGHRKSSGARIPATKLMEFINGLSKGR